MNPKSPLTKHRFEVDQPDSTIKTSASFSLSDQEDKINYIEIKKKLTQHLSASPYHQYFFRDFENLDSDQTSSQSKS